MRQQFTTNLTSWFRQFSLFTGILIPRILIVEDNDELRDFLVGEMADLYRVRQAMDGEAGWALIQPLLPDIVLTDVMMSRMDGYELPRLIKAHSRTDHIAVVMLTAKAAQPNRIDGLQQRADNYLTKPFRVNELLLRIQNLLNRQRRLQERVKAQLGHPKQSPSTELLPSDSYDNSFKNRIYILLNQQVSDFKLSVEDLASQLHIDTSSLHRKVNSLSGLSPNELIRAYRLKQASQLLRQGLTSSEAAYQTGFDSPAYFTKCFREQYRMTPSDFIKKPSTQV